jgi:Uma2 family endonuclease
MSVVSDVFPPAPEDPPVPIEWLLPLSVEQYHAMARQGVLLDGDPVELWEGLLVKKMTISPSHRLATYRTRIALERIVPAGCYVDAPSPVTFERSEPEPDVVIVRGNAGDYPDRHPGSGDLHLIVEVADSSLRRDQGIKKRIYAKAGIRVYWIVNLIDRRVEVYSDPAGPAEQPTYQSRREYLEADRVPVVIEGREVGKIAVQDVLS